MAKVLEGLYYSESHEYVRVEGETTRYLQAKSLAL